MRTLSAVLSVFAALAATVASAQAAAPASVPCTAIGGGKYDCQFYPAGDGISAGAPVQASDGHRVGYLNHGTNFVACQAKGATLTSGPYENDWWAYTEANDGADGWVNALYASGGGNDGGFGGVPACPSSDGYPPGGAPAPPPSSGSPAQVPCTSIGDSRFSCAWYVPGDGATGGTPVLSSAGSVVGYLHKGSNWIVCQQTGIERTSGTFYNNWYGWTLSDNGGYGWASAVYASGGANDGSFADVPNCGGAHGSPPAAVPTQPAPPPPAPTPPPQPGGGSLAAIRQTIVKVALSQQGYDPHANGCSRYGPNLCTGTDEGEWCSIMATWAWEQAQVQIPIYPWSGDPYLWAGPGGGFDHITGHHTYVLPESATPKPGDMVMFGSGPGQSVHVAVILQVLPSGALVVMNGNDDDGSHPDGIALKSTFFPSATRDSDGTTGPVYGYASPVADQAASSAAPAVVAPALAIGTETGVNSPLGDKRLRGQDNRAAQLKARRASRRHPAFQALPYVGSQITIEISNYQRSGRFDLIVLYRGTKHTAQRDYRRFLKRHRDHGTDYTVRYARQRAAHPGK